MDKYTNIYKCIDLHRTKCIEFTINPAHCYWSFMFNMSKYALSCSENTSAHLSHFLVLQIIMSFYFLHAHFFLVQMRSYNKSRI